MRWADLPANERARGKVKAHVGNPIPPPFPAHGFHIRIVKVEAGGRFPGTHGGDLVVWVDVAEGGRKVKHSAMGDLLNPLIFRNPPVVHGGREDHPRALVEMVSDVLRVVG